MRYEIKPLSGQLLIKVNNDNKEETKSGLVMVRQGEKWSRDNLLAEVVGIADDEKVFKIGDVGIIRGYEGKWLDKEYFNDSEDYLYRVVERDTVMALVKIFNDEPVPNHDDGLVEFMPKVS